MCVTAELTTCKDCNFCEKTICSKTGDYVDPYEPACWRFEIYHKPAEEGVLSK